MSRGRINGGIFSCEEQTCIGSLVPRTIHAGQIVAGVAVAKINYKKRCTLFET